MIIKIFLQILPFIYFTKVDAGKYGKPAEVIGSPVEEVGSPAGEIDSPVEEIGSPAEDTDSSVEDIDSSVATIGLPRVETYDYIVVGAGPAGSMVATELAQAGHSTLLMDAGKDIINANITTPTLMLKTWEDNSIAWQYYVNYYNENSDIRKYIRYPRASGLGGCTLHNAMVHIYPKQKDFDDMVHLTGDPSWGEKTFRKYFDSIKEDSRSQRSFLPISYIPLEKIFAADPKYPGLTTLIGKALINKATRFDPNGYTQESTLNPFLERKLVIDQPSQFFIPSNIKVTNNQGKRQGVREYVKKVLAKTSKLTFRGDALVTNIILEGNKATGVEYMSGEHLYRASPIADKSNAVRRKIKVRARKEVIISTGAFNSPQLLMLSGIGDPEHLKAFNIKTKINLPGVGKNLHDHYESPVTIKFDSDWETAKNCKYIADESDECWRNYQRGQGIYNAPGFFFGQPLKSSSQVLNTDLFQYAVASRWTGYSNTTTEDVYSSKRHFTINTQLPHQVNQRGRVTLKSADPRDTPNINFNYYQDGADKDIKKIIIGIKSARKQLESTRLAGWRYEEVDPGIHVQTDKELEDYIRRSTFGHHACCTNKIGRDNDPEAVLDKDFKVRKVQGLRVIDQSSIPAIWGNFPTLGTYLLGIKGADAILNRR